MTSAQTSDDVGSTTEPTSSLHIAKSYRFGSIDFVSVMIDDVISVPGVHMLI